MRILPLITVELRAPDVYKRQVSTSNPVESSQTGLKQYAVELHFTEEGAEKFADATGKLIGQRMGIFMDDTIISNPVVRDQITGGNAIIDGMERCV